MYCSSFGGHTRENTPFFCLIIDPYTQEMPDRVTVKTDKLIEVINLIYVAPFNDKKEEEKHASGGMNVVGCDRRLRVLPSWQER